MYEKSRAVRLVAERILYLVMIARGGVAHYKLAEEACEKQHGAYYHHHERQIEIRRVGDKYVMVAMIHVIQLAEAHHHHCDEAHDEH